MGLDIKSELNDGSILLLTDWSDNFTITLTPKYGRERIREEFKTFPKAMDRYAQIAKQLQKDPYWVSIV